MKKLCILSLFLFAGICSFAQTTVNSLQELLPYLNQDNVNVKLAPGTYTIDNSNVQDFTNPIFLFEGNDNTFDFTDVTINYHTEIFRAFGSVGVEEIEIIGNNNTLKNLTMVDIGSVYDRPQKTALGISLHGQDNLIEGFTMTIVGSQPYGYGDVFGKGSGYIIKHFKHSAIQVGGDRNHLKDCHITHRAYGHGIFMQGAVDPLIEGIYLEGEVRTTDAMLAGAYEGDGNTGDDVNWQTVWGYTLPAGFMLSLQEDGIRAYTKGTTIINGETISDRRTTNITVRNCTVKNMRSGYSLSLGAGTKYIEGCTSIGNESGFGIGSGDVVNCYGDAAYGTVYDGSGGVDGNVTLIAPENGYYNGAKCIASISGGTFTMNTSTTDIPSDLSIMFGSHRSFRHLPGSNLLYQVDSVFSGATVYNHSDAAIHIGPGASNCDVTTCGVVTDNGNGNSISYWDDCGVVETCNNTTAHFEGECFDEMSAIEDEGENIGSIRDGAWAMYSGLDLTDLNSVSVTASSQGVGGTIEFRLDGIDGELIAEVTVDVTGGWTNWESFSSNIARVEGTHDVYTVFKGESGWLYNIDFFGFSEDVICNNSVAHIEAECFDNMFEIQTENCTEGTENIGWIQNDDWAMYAGIDLTDMQSIKARVSGKTSGSVIEVRVDAVDGTLIGELEVTNTGGNQNWVTDSVNIQATSGVHDIYLVFKGGDGYLYNINWIGFSEESNIITDLTDTQRSALSVYPNPSTGVFNLNRTQNFKVRNALGCNILSGNGTQIDLSACAKGVYYLEIETEEGIDVYSLIRE